MKHLFKTLFFTAVLLATGLNQANAQSSLKTIYTINEGNFGSGNASVTSTSLVGGPSAIAAYTRQDAYALANAGLPLGDTAHSATIVGDELWIVVNNSHIIVRVNPETLERTGVIRIPDEGSPREIVLPGNGKAYVPLMYGHSVAVIDIESAEVTKTIQLEAFSYPDGMAYAEGHLFVANSGFGSGNTISVIDIETESVVKNIAVADNPTAVIQTPDGNIWALSSGAYGDWNNPEDPGTPGGLTAINPETLEIDFTAELTGHPSKLHVLESQNRVLFLDPAGIRSFDFVSQTLDPIPFSTGNYYNIGVFDGNYTAVLGADAKNFIQAGSVDWLSSTGEKQYSYAAGIIPGSFAFVSEISTSISDDAATTPAAFSLLPAYPNPFNPNTRVPFTLHENASVRMDVVDLTGRKVAEIGNGYYTAGTHELTFDAGKLASGVYLIRLQSGAHQAYRKVTLIK